ncbi:MAG: hypothetical protein JSR46_09885, partial [Verrucomicrobia bacterium]|nr:hypothetical protein [Verrucomicrobiota bacterium]
LACQDAPGALLPNGNVLFAACPYSVPPNFNGVPPMHIYEFNGENIFEQPSVPDGETLPASQFFMIVLPTGQILMGCIDTPNVMVYTPGDRSYNPDWAPIITCAPKKVKSGSTYKIQGVRFNGMSQGAMFGDDAQMATNYPLVRVTNKKSGYVTYCRTHGHSYMGVASDDEVYTYFDVPSSLRKGTYTIEVIANGIPSEPHIIKVKGTGYGAQNPYRRYHNKTF